MKPLSNKIQLIWISMRLK